MLVDITFPEVEFGIRLEDQACIIPVSVGQKYHDPVPFEESLNLLALQNYGKYVIVVADSLQHYTKMMRKSSLSAQEAKTFAKQKGDEWLTVSRPIIERALAGKTYEIIRWEECLSDPLASPAMLAISARYESEPGFTASIDQLVEKYLDGFETNGKKTKHNANTKPLGKTQEQLRKEKLCRHYVLEETALIMVWQNKESTFAWLPNARRFFLAYAFGGHNCNEAIYEHLTHLCQENSYQLINIKVSSEPKKQKAITTEVPSEIAAKIQLAVGAMMMMLRATGLPPEVQLAAATLMTQQLTFKVGENEELVNNPAASNLNTLLSNSQKPSESQTLTVAAPQNPTSPSFLDHNSGQDKKTSFTDDAFSSGHTSAASSLSEASTSLRAHISSLPTSRSRSNSQDREVLQAHYSENKSALYQKPTTPTSTNAAMPHA